MVPSHKHDAHKHDAHKHSAQNKHDAQSEQEPDLADAALAAPRPVPQFPFSAIVGMDDLRLGLILNAVNPAIGGVLIRGEKGTAKSTAVRALAAVLPGVDVVLGCRFSCDPKSPDPDCPDGPHQPPVPWLHRPAELRELPVGATEDRLVGSLDIEKALTEGVKSYEPGLLAAAHRGVLYVDEVNLLHDHLVDLLLDAAALGTSYVEREGVSVRHAARFLLVGTMNPEEGELRPQLLDRFGLTVEVSAPRDPALRAEVVRRRLGFDDAPATFAAGYADAEHALAAAIADARDRLGQVLLTDAMLARIAFVCAAFEVDGLRADIVTARAAVAHAAWAGRGEVTVDDVRVAARLALPHRRRRNPFDAPGLDEEQLEQALADSEAVGPEPEPDPPNGGGEDEPGDDETAPGETDPRHDAGDTAQDSAHFEPEHEAVGESAPPESAPAGYGENEREPAEPGEPDVVPATAAATQVSAPSAPFRTRRLEVPGVGAGAPGRRSKAITDTGQVTRAIRPDGPIRHLHLSATMFAAAPHQRARGRSGAGLILQRSDLREGLREGREGNLVLFVVDASGSMAARSRMATVKGAVLSLLLDAYQRRDKVGLITFRGDSATLALPATSSVEAAAARLTELPTGGRTPLADGLLLAYQTLERERLRDPQRRPLVVIVTDARHTRGAEPTAAAALLAGTGAACVVVDCESGRIRLGLAGKLARQLQAPCISLENLAVGDSLADTVRAIKDAA
ncbi:protoporphyrin IX magnesium-chelatase [Frankineae bacterium MT45]|nr:protoporphyrin IX magnesium-chelatase [Frankineae bacterium MT45]